MLPFIFPSFSLSKTRHYAHLFSQVARRGEVAFSLGLIAILVVLILPLPRILLDASLAISLTFSVVILMTVLFIEKPLDFSAFPTVLLVSTMLRLALNVASTRLILTNGHEGTHAAGEVIRAFGYFVMSGNFVIGLIVFAILVIINFVVITKGSGRIAEVAARFSLDALPGKQMAVDADLAAGVIDQSEAKGRRKAIQDETNFYGAMDGAAKFVRGDAIAAVLIGFINIIGGMIIGVAQQGLTFHQAAATYTVLTVGDGLVAQIPALIISVAAGMLVSKTDAEGSADKALFGQLGAYPMALGMSSFLMTSLSLLPGIPTLPFMALASLTGVAAWRLTEKQEKEKNLGTPPPNPAATTQEILQEALHIEAIRVELGYELLTLVHQSKGKLTDQIKIVRRDLAQNMGFLVPPIRLTDDLQLKPNQYRIRIKDIEVGQGFVHPQLLLVMDGQGRPIELDGEKVQEPVFGLPALWIQPTLQEEAELKGYTVIDPAAVISTHLTELLKDFLPELLSYSEVQNLIDGLDKAHQKLFNDTVPTQIPPSVFQRVLQNLLTERVSIRDLATILEGVSEGCHITRHPILLTEHVRSRLARQLCAAFSTAEGVLNVVTLSPEWEKAFKESLMGEGEAKQLTMAPSQLQEFVTKMKHIFDHNLENPVLLTSPLVRPYVRSVIERFRPSTVVMSQNEVHHKTKLKTIQQA